MKKYENCGRLICISKVIGEISGGFNMYYDDIIRIQSNVDIDIIKENITDYKTDQFKIPNLDLLHQITVINSKSLTSKIEEFTNIIAKFYEPTLKIHEVVKSISEIASAVAYTFKGDDAINFSYDGTDEEYNEEVVANTKIIKEIFSPDREGDEENSAIITLSPVNEHVLKYLSENPQAFYQLTDTDFEIVMAEIYNKLGYEVKRTQATRDSGKDIMIRKPEILGDFIYYVECKKYAPKRHIGVGIVRNLIGTINTDRVNGGILATTSYFSRDAREFILDNHYGYQIQMHDYNIIRELLNKVV